MHGLQTDLHLHFICNSWPFLKRSSWIDILYLNIHPGLNCNLTVSGVKGPKKIFPDMPFGNMDSDKIEARRGLLETFLKVSGLIFFFLNHIT